MPSKQQLQAEIKSLKNQLESARIELTWYKSWAPMMRQPAQAPASPVKPAMEPYVPFIPQPLECKSYGLMNHLPGTEMLKQPES